MVYKTSELKTIMLSSSKTAKYAVQITTRSRMALEWAGGNTA